MSLDGYTADNKGGVGFHGLYVKQVNKYTYVTPLRSHSYDSLQVIYIHE